MLACGSSRMHQSVALWSFVQPVIVSGLLAVPSTMSTLRLNTLFYRPQNLLYSFCRHRFWVYFKQWVYFIPNAVTVWFYIIWFVLFLCCAVTSCSKSRRDKTNWNPSVGHDSWTLRINSWCIRTGRLQLCCVWWTQLQERTGVQPITDHWWL